jgi:hypothetical protein
MLYYTIYMKGLQNGSGYIDVALESDDLLKDYTAYLDMGMKNQKTYNLVDPGKTGKRPGRFAVSLSDIIAITIAYPG